MITDRETAAVTAAYPPSVKHPDTVRAMMADVLIALFPAAVWGVYSFGIRAVSIMLVSVVTAVVSEIIFEYIAKRRFSAENLSSVVTGLLLAYLMPVSVPLYVPAIGAAFAVLIVKCAFGGLGANLLNPALTGYVFVKLCFPEQLRVAGDLLEILKSGGLPDSTYYDAIVGNIPGGIGEVSSLLLIAGGVYLLVRGVIDWRIPVLIIGCVAVITLILPNDVNNLSFMMYEIFSGALILAAIFMATDPVTTPVTWPGRLIFAFICGMLTVLIRYFGPDTEGVAYAILTANLLSGVIDRIVSPGKVRYTDEKG